MTTRSLLWLILLLVSAVGCAGRKEVAGVSGTAPAGWMAELPNGTSKFRLVPDEYLVVFRRPLSSKVDEAFEAPMRRLGAIILSRLAEMNALLVRVDRIRRAALLETMDKAHEIEFVVPNRVAHQLSDVKGRPGCVFSGAPTLPAILAKGQAELRQGAHIVNISLGLVATMEASVEEFLIEKRRWRASLLPLVRAARAADAIVVLASGNSGLPSDDILFPSWVSNEDAAAWQNHVIVVGATDKNDRPTEISDKGKVVDLYAPGEDLEVPQSRSHEEVVIRLIRAVAPEANLPEANLPELPPATDTVLCSGTSFAAALVSGMVALARGAAATLPPPFPAPSVKRLLVETSDVAPGGVRIPNGEMLVRAIKKLEEASRQERGDSP